MNEAPKVLEARSLSHGYADGVSRVQILQDVNLELHAGESLAVIGASGSGKSTLLHLLGGLSQPNAGEVLWSGQSLAHVSASKLGAWRNRHLGFVYQFHHLLPELSALENVALPLQIRRAAPLEAKDAAARWLSAVGLGTRLHHRSAELSGGERQRVALARALVTEPACILADEPTGNLDRENADRVFDLLREQAAEQGSALILVTHDTAIAARCQRQLRLQAGRLVDATVGAD